MLVNIPLQKMKIYFLICLNSIFLKNKIINYLRCAFFVKKRRQKALWAADTVLALIKLFSFDYKKLVAVENNSDPFTIFNLWF